MTEKPPQDYLNFVYICSLMNGIGILIPWNMFITIAPQYYVNYWFTSADGNKTSYATNFMSSLGVAAQVPNLSITVVNLLLVFGGSLLARIRGPLVLNIFSVLVIIILIYTEDPREEAMRWFYFLTLAIVVVMNLASGIYQNSVYGLFADFPAKHTNAVLLGNNICGTVTTIISILCTLYFPDTRMVALLYFSISLMVVVLCLVLMMLITKSKYYTHHTEKAAANRIAEKTESPHMRQYWDTVRMGWMQFFNVFLVFFVTLTIFPAVLTSVEPQVSSDGTVKTFLPEKIHLTVTVFLNFNVFATIGTFLADFVQWPSPRFLWVPVILRIAFIPFFLFCNFLPDQRKLPVIFNDNWMFTLGISIMAVTSGYLASLGMIYAPRVVADSLSKIAGMLAGMFLVLGIFCGVSFSFLCNWIVL